MSRLKKTLPIAICVSLASQVKFDFLTDGFIIAMSVMVMVIFIYCYEDLSPMYVAFSSGIFSPLIRLTIEVGKGGQMMETAYLVIPDMVFFFTFGILYTLIYQIIVQGPKSIRNFPYVIFTCDFLSNLAELSTRSLLQAVHVVDTQVIIWILVIALCRTALVQAILMAMEAYSSLLVREEHDREYRKLLIQASIFESELHVMEKNVADIEEIMKQAFQIHQEMKDLPVSRQLQNKALDVAKNSHEVKGDYLNIISALKEVFFQDMDESRMRMSDLIRVEKGNVQSTMKNRQCSVEIISRSRTDFYVQNYFKMMSVIRNLMLNGAEAAAAAAAGGRPGGARVHVFLHREETDYVLTVHDNGCGISQNRLETIFLEGFSTKFNEKTGDMQRGMGLTLVKDYVENFFKGTISVASQPGQYTEFTVRFPADGFQEVRG